MSTAGIIMEGVIRRPIGGQPIKSGVDLYYGLATRMKIVLITMDPQTEIEYWLQSEGMHEHVNVIYSDPVIESYSPVVSYHRMILQAARFGNPVDLVVLPDPAVAGYIFSQGFNTLLFSETTYAAPQWRPDYKHKTVPWDELSNQVAHEAWLRAQDEAPKDVA